ncbi:MAG: hypothetical protein WD766_13935 [Gemmatimonadota bacterium]
MDSQNQGEGGGNRRDAFDDLQAKLERAIEDLKPKVRKALDELDATVDSALSDLKPKVDAKMREAQPRVDSILSDVQPRMDSLLRRMQAKLEEVRVDLESRANRGTAEGGAPGSQTEGGSGTGTTDASPEKPEDPLGGPSGV